MGPLMINMAYMPLYMWEMWYVTPVTHTHGRAVESRAVFCLSRIRNTSNTCNMHNTRNTPNTWNTNNTSDEFNVNNASNASKSSASVGRLSSYLSTPPDLMSPGLERHHYHVCPSWWHHPLSKQYHRTDDNTHNDDITTNNYITLDHNDKPHRRLGLIVLLPLMHMLPIVQGEQNWTV